MSKATVLQLVGEQPMPNILFLKEFAEQIQHCYLIVTTQTKGVVDMIKKGTEELDIEYTSIDVKPDDLLDIEQTLRREVKIDPDMMIIGNITGGTKVMSLALFNFLKELGADGIYYLTVNKNTIQQIFPQRKYGERPLKTRLDLVTYLQGSGLKSKSGFDKKNDYYRKATIEKEIPIMFNAFVGENKAKATEIMRAIQIAEKRGKAIQQKADPALFELVRQWETLGFTFDNPESISKHETKFLTGDWLEARVYEQVLRALPIPESQAAIGISLQKQETDNEYDVMFIHDNLIYVIECKTSVTDKSMKPNSDHTDNEEEKFRELFASTLYKADSLKRDFGLSIRYYLASLHDFKDLNEAQVNRAKKLGITLIGLDALTNDDKFREVFKL
jgi:hypothetical protein